MKCSKLLIFAFVAVICLAMSAAPTNAAVTPGGDYSPSLPWGSDVDVLIGDTGIGTLLVNGGDTVSVDSCNVGQTSTGDGTITIDGANSKLTADSYVMFGRNGIGKLNITNGGTLDADSNSNYLGYTDGSTAYAKVDGENSTWTNLSTLSAGQGGNATLDITDKGLVSATSSIIAWFATSTSSAKVEGAGSTWSNSSYMTVGYSGDGTLDVLDGGTVTCDKGRLAYNAGSVGKLTVSGVDSTFTANTEFYVGRKGAGTLNVSNSGTVIANVVKSDTGAMTLNFDGGTLKSYDAANADWIAIGSGGGNVYLKEGGAKFDTNGFDMGIAAPLQHGGAAATDGGLTKIGAGKLTLAGTNTYTGLTTLQEGSLILGLNAHNAVLGLGGVDIQTETGKLVFDYTGGDLNASTVRSLLATSFNSGWTSGQFLCSIVDSAHGLGFGDNTTEENVFVQYALCGDANFDSSVNLLDLTILSANWSDTDKLWTDGDFNYDGEVNLLDLTILSANWGQTDLTFQQAAAMVGLTAVPEPGTFVLIVSAALALVAVAIRRRRA